MAGDGRFEFLSDGILDQIDALIRKLLDLSALIADKMIVMLIG